LHVVFIDKQRRVLEWMQNKLTLETNLKLKCKYLYPEISPFPYIRIIPQQYSDYQYTVLDLITGVINEG